MWTFLRQQQQRGAQLPMRSRPPTEAVKDREAQEHDRADLDVQGGRLRQGSYPATPIEHLDGDDTPTTPSSYVSWDEIVQPEKKRDDDLPPPEGK